MAEPLPSSRFLSVDRLDRVVFRRSALQFCRLKADCRSLATDRARVSAERQAEPRGRSARRSGIASTERSSIGAWGTSRPGCQPHMRQSLRTRNPDSFWIAPRTRSCAESAQVLFCDEAVEARVETWSPGAIVGVENERGMEFLVLSGSLTVECLALKAQVRGRLPAGVPFDAEVGRDGATSLDKAGFACPGRCLQYRRHLHLVIAECPLSGKQNGSCIARMDRGAERQPFAQ